MQASLEQLLGNWKRWEERSIIGPFFVLEFIASCFQWGHYKELSKQDQEDGSGDSYGDSEHIFQILNEHGKTPKF